MNKNRQFKINWFNSRNLITATFAFSSLIGSPNSVAATTRNDAPMSIVQIINQKKVTLNISNKPLKFILNEIKRQSEVGFVLSDKLIDKELDKLSIKVDNVTVLEALNILLKDTDYESRIVDDVITIVKKDIKNQEQKRSAVKIEIRGRVVDGEDRKSIAGATVIVKDTNLGAITDMNGEFAFIAELNQIVEISCVGMQAREVKITDASSVSLIVLKRDAMVLDDVVVTGHNDIKRSSYTGNATVVKRDELLKASKTSVMKALQIFDPSFRMKDNNMWGSDPNSLPEMNIRGSSSFGKAQASFNGDGTVTRNDLSKSNIQDNPNLPTFIMDGFEISATKLYDFDPNRIESVTILKDAAATALYGSRAANGVVVITTVTPKPGKLNVSYNFTGSISAPDLSDYNLMNAAEKLETERRAGYFDWDPIRNAFQNPYDLKKEYNLKRANVLKGIDTYWLSKPLTPVFNDQHTLYIDGGSDAIRFGVDLQYSNKDGVMKGSSRDNYSAGFYLQYNYKNISIKNYASYRVTKSQESPYGDFSDYANQLPYDEYKDENGKYLRNLRNWGSGTGNFNPLYESTLYNYNRSKSDELINNLILNWKITPDLLLKGQLSLTKETSGTDEFYDPMSLNPKNSNQLSYDNISSGTLYKRNGDNLRLDFSSTLSYNKAIKNHMINALIGMNIMETVSNSDNATYLGFPSGVLSSPQYANKMYERTNFSEATNRLVGFLTSVNYSFKDTYLLDASVRVDGSSNFGSDKRFAPFWSFGTGINIHKYDFMKNIKWIDLLKIRGSYGQTGKANFSAYQARTTFQILTDEWYKTGYGAELKGIGNSNLTWETTNTFDIGGELQLFDNLLYIKGSYYNKRTIDLVNSVTVPSSTGFSTYTDNVGEVSNKGFEFDLRIQAIKKRDFSLIINANIGHNKNILEKISESQKAYNKKVQDVFSYWNNTTLGYLGLKNVTPFLQYEEGGSLSSIYGVRSLGINPADGNEVYLSRMGLVSNTWESSDQVILGNNDPKAQGSFGFNLTYKQFNLYTSFMYEFGGQRFNQTLMDKVENVNIYTTNLDKRVLNERWQNPGDNAKYKALQYDKMNTYLTKPTSRFVQDYNMLSLNSVEFSYDFSPEVTNKLNMSMLRLSIGMNDIFNISSVKQERGLSYPYARLVNFSVKISF